MRVAFVAFDRMTALDLVGAFDPVTRLSTMEFRDLEWDICARAPVVTATAGFRVEAATPGSLEAYDVLVVPGGYGTRPLVDDADFLGWLRSADPDLTAAVCTGSLLLGAAGYLEGRRATTHPEAFDDLAAYCEVLEDRVVDAGDLVTARGVTAGIDLGLHLVERLSDASTREAVARQMDYPHFDPEAVRTD